ENVTRARKRAERDHCEDREHDIVKDEQTLAEYQRRQYQRVFDPLMGPRQADHRGQLAGALAVVQLWRRVHRISLYRSALCHRKTAVTERAAAQSAQPGQFHLTASCVCENSTAR